MTYDVLPNDAVSNWARERAVKVDEALELMEPLITIWNHLPPEARSALKQAHRELIHEQYWNRREAKDAQAT